MFSRTLNSGTQICHSTGIDWAWQNQDGGKDKKGRVSRIQQWNNHSANSGAMVCWSQSGQQELYRVGFQGMTDLKVVEPAKGDTIYRDHLISFAHYIDMLYDNHNHSSSEDIYFNEWY